MKIEKEQRSDSKTKVNMQIVDQLLNIRERRNHLLQYCFGYCFCDLYPSENSQTCLYCPQVLKKTCFDNKLERDYIHSQERNKKIHAKA